MNENANSIKKAHPDTLGTLIKPLSLRGIPPWAIYFSALLGFFYILNPTAGFIEFIPDNIPIIGNLDEGVAFTMLWYGLVEYFEGRKYRAVPPSQDDADDPNIIDVDVS